MHYFKRLSFDFIDMLNFEERPFRAKFIPAKIWDELDAYKNDSVGLRNYFRKWRTRIEFKKPKKETTYIAVGGWYLVDKGSSVVELWTENYDKRKFTNGTWNRLKFKMIQVLMHELIHCRQYLGKHEDYVASTVKYYRTGNKRLDDNRHYHSGRDEIEAYAHCIYTEYAANRPKIPIPTLIRRSRTTNDSNTFKGIVKVFGNDPRNNHALVLLARKILTWERKYKQFLPKP